MIPRDVLIVDDTADCLIVMSAMLVANGYAVRCAESGPEALGLIDARAPDVVLLDVMMPGMTGIEVLERLRGAHATARIPVIMITACIDDDDVLIGYQHGADYYITKPCTARQVMHGIALVCGDIDKASAA
ncbi:MAG: response regulator [Candidatus Binatia bacterium]